MAKQANSTVKLKNKTRQVLSINLLNEKGEEFSRQLAPKELTEELVEERISPSVEGLVRGGYVQKVR